MPLPHPGFTVLLTGNPKVLTEFSKVLTDFSKVLTEISVLTLVFTKVRTVLR